MPILYEVDRIRDGRSFTTRRVVAIQHGRAIFNLSASFHDSTRRASTTRSPCPTCPTPETLAPLVERLEPWRDELADWFDRPHPIDQRHIGELPWHRTGRRRALSSGCGSGPTATLPDDPLLHACVATYASDMTLFDTMLGPPRRAAGTTPEFMGASLDHCMWFHRPFRADEWLLYDTDCPVAAYGPRPGPRLPLHQSGELVRVAWPRRA